MNILLQHKYHKIILLITHKYFICLLCHKNGGTRGGHKHYYSQQFSPNVKKKVIFIPIFMEIIISYNVNLQNGSIDQLFLYRGIDR